MSGRAPRGLPVPVQLTVLSGMTAGAQGLMALLIAKWLGASDRGVLALGQTIVNLIVLAASLGLLSSARIVLSSPRWGLSLRQYVRATRPLVGLDLVVTAVAALTVFPLLSRVSDPVLAAALVIMGTAHLRSGLLREGLHGVGWHRTAVTGEFVGAAAALGLLGALWASGTLTLHTGMLSVVARPLVHQLVQTISVRRQMAAEPPGTAQERGLLGRLVRFSTPGLAVAAGMGVAGQMDRVLLGAFAGPAPVGVYASAATLSVLAGTLPAAVAPMVVRSVARGWQPAMHRYWWTRVMLGSAGISVLIGVFGSLLLEVWLGGEFAGSTPILVLLLLGGMAMASQLVDNSVNNGFGDLRASAVTALAGIPVGLIAYLVLIPLFGMVGCAVGNVLTYVTMAVVARLLMRRTMARHPAPAADEPREGATP